MALRDYPLLTNVTAPKLSLQFPLRRVPNVPPGTALWIGDQCDMEWFEGPAVWDGECWRFYPTMRMDQLCDGQLLWTHRSADLFVYDWSWTPYSWQEQWAAEWPDAWSDVVNHALDPGEGAEVAGWPACGVNDWRYVESPAHHRVECQHPACVAARKQDFSGLFGC